MTSPRRRRPVAMRRVDGGIDAEPSGAQRHRRRDAPAREARHALAQQRLHRRRAASRAGIVDHAAVAPPVLEACPDGMEVELDVLAGGGDLPADRRHRRVAEVAVVERLDEERRGQACRRQRLEHEAEPFRASVDAPVDGLLPERRVDPGMGQRAGDRELDVDGDQDLGAAGGAAHGAMLASPRRAAHPAPRAKPSDGPPGTAPCRAARSRGCHPRRGGRHGWRHGAPACAARRPSCPSRWPRRAARAARRDG